MNNKSNELFKLIWNNIYLKNQILYYCKLYKVLKDNIIFYSIKELNEFENKEYLKDITIDFNLDINQLPTNIDSIILNNYCSVYNIPNQIKSFGSILQIDYSIFKSSSCSNLQKLYLDDAGGSINEIPSNTLPNSIKVLSLNYYHQLKKNVLPNSLTKLTIKGCLEIDSGALPNSLLNIKLHNIDPDKINSSLPSGLIKFEIFAGPNKSITNQLVLPNSLIKLRVRAGQFDTILPIGLESLQILVRGQLNIKLSNSIQHLKVTSGDRVFNKVLPSSIKSLQVLYESLDRSNLPSNLESLKFINHSGVGFNSEIKKNQLNLNLKSLCFELNGTFYNNNNQPLTPSILPSSLTYINFGNGFNLDIQEKVLPITLKILILGNSYSKVLHSKSIPFNLEHLKILNLNYNHQIVLDNSYTMVSCSNIINCYYQRYNESAPNQLRVLKLSNQFNESLSTLSLQNKSNLEYLHLGDYGFNQSIQLSDLPVNNNIKILELSSSFNQIINLNYFQNLQSLIINGSSPIIQTTIDNGYYNYYNLKSIQLNSLNNNQFIKSLNNNFYQFIKINNNLNKNKTNK